MSTDFAGMDQEFQIVIITSPRFFPGEAEMLSLLLGGLDCRVHLRKPGCTERQMRGLIEALPEEFRPELTLQDHLSLVPEWEACIRPPAFQWFRRAGRGS